MTQDDTTSCDLFSQTVLKLFIQFSTFGGFCLAYCAVYLWSIFKACSPLSCSLMYLFLFLFSFLSEIYEEEIPAQVVLTPLERFH